MNLRSFVVGDNLLSPEEKKHREVLMYLIFGALTTVVNLITYFLLDTALENNTLYIEIFTWSFDLLEIGKQTIAWIAAVTFAFFTNRSIVFCSKGPFFKEMAAFFSARVATLVIFELVVFMLMISFIENVLDISKGAPVFTVGAIPFKWNMMAKVINSVFVVVSNYFFSKWFVFTKKQSMQTSDTESSLAEKKEGETDE